LEYKLEQTWGQVLQNHILTIPHHLIFSGMHELFITLSPGYSALFNLNQKIADL